jgi:hypothetical protein
MGRREGEGVACLQDVGREVMMVKNMWNGAFNDCWNIDTS